MSSAPAESLPEKNRRFRFFASSGPFPPGMERILPHLVEIKKTKTMKTFPAKIFLTVLLLLAATAVLIPVGCDDSDSDSYERYDSRVTAATWNTFRTLYPKAYNVRWYIRGPYAVAYFTDTPGSPFSGIPENAAWFRNDKGLWVMTEAEMTFQALPDAVKKSFSAGGYDTWIVEEVVRIERHEAETLYAIDAVSGRTELFLYYTASGLLAYILPDDDVEKLIPSTLPGSVASYLSEHYPAAGLLNASVTAQGTQVDLADGMKLLSLRFDPTGIWLSTTEENLPASEIPQEILQAWEQSDYSSSKGFHLDKAHYVQTSYDGNYYLFDLTSISGPMRIRISTDGTVTPVTL